MYVLVQDNDGHWYVIPNVKQNNWWSWCETSSMDIPDFATQVGGSTTLVKFDNFIIE